MTQPAIRVAICTSVHDATDARITFREGRVLADEFDATLYVLQDGPDSTVDATRDGRTLSVRRLGMPRSRIRRFLSGPRLLRTALADGPDVVIIHDPEMLPWLRLIVGRRGALTVYDVHEDYPSWIRIKQWIPSPLRAPVAWLVDRLERTLARGVDVILVADTFLLDRFAGHRRSPLLVRNHAPLDLFDAGAPMRDRGRLIAYVGGITAVRGSGAMVASFELARKRVPDAELLLIGPVQDASLRDLPEGSRATGRMSYDLIGAELARARAGFSIWTDTPKNRHNVPSKLFDYMAAGVPFLTSDFDNIREASDGEGGLFFDPDDIPAIADALVRLLTDDGFAEGLREEALLAVRERYAFEPEGRRLVEEIRVALEGRDPR
ncbi:MAG: glycosyltransferase [Coriobacteriia bacterium]|nr:glycosyltransferase [Coriobacteriia bacterium]